MDENAGGEETATAAPHFNRNPTPFFPRVVLSRYNDCKESNKVNAVQTIE